MSGKWISGPAAFLILVLFFLPWVTISCNGEPIGDLSGYELATGSNRDLPVDADFQLLPAASGGDMAWLFVPLMALLVGGILALAFWRPQWVLLAGVGQGGAALWGLLILFLEWRLFQGAQEGLFEITIMPALWGTVIAFLLILLGGIVDTRQGLRQRQGHSLVAAFANQEAGSFHPAMAPPLNSQRVVQEPAESWPPVPLAQDVFGGVTDPGGTHSDVAEVDPIPANYGTTRVDSDEVEERIAPLLKGTAPLPGDRMLVETAVEPEDMPLTWDPPAPAAGPASSQKLPLAWLVIREGPKAGEQYRLQALTRIGRGPDNEIILVDTAVSGSHGQIAFADGQYVYQDLGSTNGSMRFNQETQQWQHVDRMVLSDGAQLKMGRVVFHFMSL